MLARDSWSRIPIAGFSQHLVYGGRDRRLFVVDGKEIQSFDATGKPLGKLDTAVAIDAISYDQKNNRLLAASAAAGKLLAIGPMLEVLGQTELPQVAGQGALAMSVNGRDATIVISREGSREAATLRWRASGALTSGRFTLMTVGRTGLPAGPILKVACSSHNFDPVRSKKKKEWRN